MNWIKKTKNKSYCCNKPIYYRESGDRFGGVESDPYCTGCGKFPIASPEAIEKAKELLCNEFKEKQK